jgi:hypothetical protein
LMFALLKIGLEVKTSIDFQTTAVSAVDWSILA